MLGHGDDPQGLRGPSLAGLGLRDVDGVRLLDLDHRFDRLSPSHFLVIAGLDPNQPAPFGVDLDPAADWHEADGGEGLSLVGRKGLRLVEAVDEQAEDRGRCDSEGCDLGALLGAHDLGWRAPEGSHPKGIDTLERRH